MDQWFASQSAYFIFQFFDKHWISGGVAGHCSVTGRVDEVVITDMMQELAPFHTQYEVEVPFIQVYHSETVYSGFAFILFQH